MDKVLNIAPLEVPFNKKVLWLIVISGVLTLPPIILSFFFIDKVSDFFLVPPLLLFILVFHFYFFYAIQQLRSKSVALCIDEFGIHDNTSPFSIGLVEWGQIKEVHYAYQDYASLSLWVKDSKFFIKQERNYLKKLLLFYQMKREKTPVLISSFFMSMSRYELMEEIKKRKWEGTPFEDLSKHLIID